MPDEKLGWGALKLPNPHKAYRYRPNNEFLLDSIEKALTEQALWMCPLSTQDDLVEASVALKPTDFSEKHKRMGEAFDRLATFWIDSNSKLMAEQNGHHFSEAEFGKLMQEEITHSFQTVLGEKILNADEEELPNLVEECRAKLRCACFVSSPTSGVMWGLYANNHEGCCLEYDDHYNRHFYIFNLLAPKLIEYSQEKRILDRFDIWEVLAFLTYSNRIEGGPFSISSQNDPRVMAAKLLFLTKSNEFSWQEEFRVVDLGETQGYASWEHLKLRKVIFGARSSNEFIQEVRERFSTELTYSQITTEPGNPELQIVDI
ncbi:DUF2971 domain-containing protein [uncultured Roseibium sp.]|uniref:DUF2971 domain-containing protein n=1 Tax=uncultured Roseibium sp. TaxID=1936171 RepID=UPI002620FBC4|nr:DUF2971 domain-containing protein [uncultured Roseibium sp.]